MTLGTIGRATVALAATTAVLGATAARAQTPPGPVAREAAMPQTVSVTGTGKVALTPDRASFSAGVQTMAPTVSAAVQENSRLVTAILAALRQAGAADKELRTSSLSISPQQSYREGQPPKIVGYQVHNEVTVTRDDAASIGRLIEAAVNAGANTVSGVTFTVSNPARGRDAGLQAAFANARAKAEVLARAAGRTAGRALAITEEGAAAPPPRPMFRTLATQENVELAAPAPVEAGTEEMSFTISVVFELM
jgi:uncharacterized protein YggE